MTTLENLGSEDRKFAPSAEFAAKANAQAEIYARAKVDRLKFWEDAALGEKVGHRPRLAIAFC
jgi:acetyl-CoA synthetase